MNTIEFITQITNAFLHVYLVVFFFSIFCEAKYRIHVTVISCAFITALLSIGLIWLGNGILRFICVYGLTFAISFLINSKMHLRIIYTSIIYALNSIVEVLIASSFKLILGINVNSAGYSIFLVAMLISKFVTLIVLIFIKLKKHDSLPDNKIKNKHWGLFLFPLSTLLFSILITTVFIQSPNQSDIVQILTLVAFSILILANIIIFDYIDSLKENIDAQNSIRFANGIIKEQTKQYEALIEHNKEIIRIKHDHKNFCIGVISALKEGKVEDALNKISDEYNLCSDDRMFQDSVLQAIVEMKKKTVEDSNIEIRFESQSLNKIDTSPIDIAIIVGNALDNAIDACKKIENNDVLQISVKVFTKHNNTFIIIENPVNENIDAQKLVSSKPNNSGHHGIGIISMKKIAEKYNGDIVFDCADKKFIATIILKNAF